MNTLPTQGSQGERCGNCGTFHHPPRRSCPAYGTKCDACGKFGHWRSVCHSCPRAKTSHKPSRDKQHRPQQGVHTIDTTEPDTDYPTAQSIDIPHMLDTPQLYFHSLYIYRQCFRKRHPSLVTARSGRRSEHYAPTVQSGHRS